jgi:hypothetical protein
MESFWMGVIMIPLAFVGVMICQRKTHAAVYFVATMLISWMAIRNNGLMSFTNVNGPQVRPLLDQLFDQTPGSFLRFLLDYGPALLADLFAVISICALVMLQIWVGLAFLTNAGSYDNAFKLSFYSTVTAFALVCIVCGAMAAMQAPWLIWQGVTEVNPINMFRYGQAILAHTFSLS